MTDSGLPFTPGPADCSPEERARAVAAILAGGLLRLRKPTVRGTSPPSDSPENLSESPPNCLADSADTSVTVSTG
jgi:hypothetical protein